MAALPPRADLDQLRHRAEDRLRAARDGDEEAIAWIGEVSDRLSLAAARLRLARHYGFASWPRLVAEVERRRLLDRADAGALAALVAEHPAMATSELEHWQDHPLGASPLGYLAMLRYDTAEHVWRDVGGTGAAARVLLDAGAPLDGPPGASETPLITAASYGDAEIARLLVERGADLEAVAADDAGGVPGGTALLHAAVFGMTAVVDVLVAAGSRVRSIEEAAAAGDVSTFLAASAPDSRLRALVLAADHQRLAVIDQLVAAGTPVDDTDPAFGGHPLRTAAANGRPAALRALLAHGADPARSEPGTGHSPLELCRRGRATVEDTTGHDEVEQILLAALGSS